jgi:hypothetical protein
MRTVTKRRINQQTRELEILRVKQERLLREVIRAELRAYNHTNPLSSELVLYEGVWDTIKDAAAKAVEFGREVAADFKKGWERVSNIVSKALTSVTNEMMEKVKSFIESITKVHGIIKGKVKSYGAEKVRRLLSVFKDEHGHAEEGKALADGLKSNKCVDDAMKAMREKAKELDSDGPKVQINVDEGRRMARSTRFMVESGSKRTVREGKSRGLIKEAFDPLSISSIILVFGGVMLIFKILATVFKYIGGECANFWTKAGAWCQKAYDMMHHFEQAVLDTVIPDVVAVEIYDLYIFCGGAPIEGDTGRDALGGSAPYKKGKLVGELGADRDVDIKELEGNDKFRRAIKARIYQFALFFMLMDAIKTLTALGFSALYGVKAAVKTGEIAVGAAGEVSAAMRAGRAAVSG